MPLFRIVYDSDTEEYTSLIRNDLLDSFIDYTNSFKKFDFHQTLPKPLTHVSYYGINLPLLSYAAFHNANKIFKFLLLNGTDPQQRIFSNKTALIHQYPLSAIHFAVAGGNIEAIKILDERNTDFSYLTFTAVSYFRNDILEWLLDVKEMNIHDYLPNKVSLYQHALSTLNYPAILSLKDNV